jgi:creatinine amidohydrolase
VHHLLPTSTSTDEGQRNTRAAVLPIGSFEQHGSYLPLITDSVIATTISAELAAAYPLLQLPPVTISCSHKHSAWPGTVSISATTLLSVVADVADSVRRSGLSALVLVNGHGGNYALSNLVQEANAHGNRIALFPTGQDWKDARLAAQLETTMHEDMHSGEIETSILLYAHPELVRDGYETADCIANDRRHLLVKGMSAYTTSGVIGRPSLASADKGKAVLASFVQSFAEILRVLDA